jgi:hypothetical protein
MPPTQEQLDQWRKEFEAARSFEDDDLWLPPSPKHAPSARNTPSTIFRNANQETDTTRAPHSAPQANGAHSDSDSNAPTTNNIFPIPLAPSSNSTNPATTSHGNPMVYNTMTKQWVPAVRLSNGHTYFPAHANSPAFINTDASVNAESAFRQNRQRSGTNDGTGNSSGENGTPGDDKTSE